MSINQLPLKMRNAIKELQDTILVRYPDALFEVDEGEEADNVNLYVTVDLVDTDPVLDLVIDRVMDLQLHQQVPIHVRPRRTPEREAQVYEEELKARGSSYKLSLA
ncbi:hypothetical protein ACGF07_26155 [Kitasatospora sp. NPDC048194]|uniref:hypothetical protein n=1 Tax=Kitasatospora sp. NPDC048194 TaxID=3364045 RepID=UPI003720CE53